MREASKLLTNTTALYAAFKAKDSRFDGHFFVGISSTMVYCRPVCRARQPKFENCSFYKSAAAAEQAGYRPCLLCRPELAPGSSPTDATVVLVHRAARMIAENCGNGQSLAELAVRLGCSERHFRRVFTAAYNVSPIKYLQTCRLLLAKNLLTDTSLSVLDVALAAGFGSLRRFNDLFKNYYKIAPTDIRKKKSVKHKHCSEITLTLSYRPPYQWEKILHFLAGRAIAGVEIVTDNEYMRTVHLKNVTGNYVYGWIRVRHQPQKNALAVTISETLLPVLSQVLIRVRHLFDLDCDPDTIYETLNDMNKLRPELCSLGTRLPGCFDAFEMAVRAILGQQITVKAASTLAARIVQTYGTPITTGVSGLTHLFPVPEAILALDGDISNHFGRLGVISARARTIYSLAQALVQAEIDLNYCAQPEQEMNKLMQIRGIGSWTAQYIAMRALGWTDAFLEIDAAIKKALQPYSSKQLLQLSEVWRPWRSYATINIWNIL